ncbi:MAG: SMP-30/gluconolactonase/LRE family protein [Verrucomicrobiota bacterium]
MSHHLSSLSARVFIGETFALGEGPFWFENRLWWVDIDAGTLHSADEAGQNRTTRHLGRRIGAAAPADSRRFVVALEDGIGLLDRESGGLQMLAAPESHIPDNRFNDGKCDPVGRFVAGTLSRSGQRQAAALYSIDGHGTCRKIFAPVTLSNGLAWSDDGRTLYHVDSLNRQIAAFDYDLETGRIANRRIAVEVPENMGLPDGMDIDDEGNLWVAHWGGWAVRCWSPATGRRLAEIPMPCSAPTSCCFGGASGSTLFITTARTEETGAGELEWAGKIFLCETSRKGRPPGTFAVQDRADPRC